MYMLCKQAVTFCSNDAKIASSIKNAQNLHRSKTSTCFDSLTKLWLRCLGSNFIYFIFCDSAQCRQIIIENKTFLKMSICNKKCAPKLILYTVHAPCLAHKLSVILTPLDYKPHCKMG